LEVPSVKQDGPDLESPGFKLRTSNLTLSDRAKQGQAGGSGGRCARHTLLLRPSQLGGCLQPSCRVPCLRLRKHAVAMSQRHVHASVDMAPETHTLKTVSDGIGGASPTLRILCFAVARAVYASWPAVATSGRARAVGWGFCPTVSSFASCTLSGIHAPYSRPDKRLQQKRQYGMFYS
jgi:hypothetical protein